MVESFSGIFIVLFIPDNKDHKGILWLMPGQSSCSLIGLFHNTLCRSFCSAKWDFIRVVNLHVRDFLWFFSIPPSFTSLALSVSSAHDCAKPQRLTWQQLKRQRGLKWTKVILCLWVQIFSHFVAVKCFGCTFASVNGEGGGESLGNCRVFFSSHALLHTEFYLWNHPPIWL